LAPASGRIKAWISEDGEHTACLARERLNRHTDLPLLRLVLLVSGDQSLGPVNDRLFQRCG
jgi:hypothetical protein